MASLALENPYCSSYGLAAGHKSIPMILIIVASIIALIITTLITYQSAVKLPKLKQLHQVIKYLYISSLIISYLIFLIALIQAIICIAANLYYESIVLHTFFVTLYSILILLLLAMLTFRLYYSFLDSIFSLSKIHQIALVIAYIMVIIAVIVDIICYMIVTFKYRGNWNMAEAEHIMIIAWIGPIALCLYIVLSIYTLCLFVKKLMNLTKLQRASTHNVELSRMQISMVNKAAKYAQILSVAIFTSIIASVVWSLEALLWDTDDNWDKENSFLTQLMVLISTIDVMVNVICLYLQFSFAAKYYDKFCKVALDFVCCCSYWLTLDVKKSIEMVKLKNIETVDSDAED